MRIANLCASCVPPIDNVSFTCLQRAVPERHDGFEWVKWHTLTLSLLNISSHSQLTIANLRASFLSPKDDESFKYLQICSWQTVLEQPDGSEWFKWHTLHCLALIWHPIYIRRLLTRVQVVFYQHIKDPWNVFKDAVDGLFQGIKTALNSSNDINCIVLP